MNPIQTGYVSVLIAVLFAYPTCAEEDGLYLNTTRTNWATSCGGLGPAAVTGLNMTSLNLDGDFSFMSEGQKAWVGYYRRVQYFSLEGCSQIPSPSKTVRMNDNSPGHCLSVYKECNHIGLEADACNCISDDEFNLMSLTSDACPYTSCNGGILCGNSTASWIYAPRVADFGPLLQQSPSTKVQCITLTREFQASWKTIACDKGMYPTPILCLKNESMLDLNALNSKQDSWIEAVKRCRYFSDNIGAIDRGNFRNIVTSTTSLFQSAWTSFILDSVIVNKETLSVLDERLSSYYGAIAYDSGREFTECTKLVPKLSRTHHGMGVIDPIACGTIQKTNGAVKLQFEGCTTTMSAVCVNVITPNISSQSSTSITQHNPPATTTFVTTARASTMTSQRALPETMPTKTISKITTYLTSNTSLSLKPTSTKTIHLSTSSLPITMTESSQKGDFPMYGRIGLGILFVLVIAGLVLVIQRMTAIKKRPPSTQITSDSSEHQTELSRRIPMLGVNEKEVSDNDGENEIKMKGTSNDCSKDGNVASDANYECIQDESNIKHSNGGVGNSTGQRDNAHSTNSQYATVVKVGKSSQKITETNPESDTNAYDTTYMPQDKSRDTSDDYQHIYDHANYKNPE